MLKPRRWNVPPTGLQPSALGLAHLPPLSACRQPKRGKQVSSRARLKKDVLDVSYVNRTLYQYKRATDQVASWLVLTAKVCGYPAESLTINANSNNNDNDNDSNKTSQVPPQRLERKAEEFARDGKASVSSTASVAGRRRPKPFYTYNIALEDFQKLASFIAASDPPVRVPEEFMKAVERSISWRNSHIQQVCQPRSAASRFSKNHEYFVHVLEDVLRVLRAGEARGQAKDSLTHASKKRPTSTRKPAAPELTSEDRLRQDMKKAYLGFDLLLKDFRSLRAVILRTWTGYQMGLCDLTTVSLVTNSALAIAWRLQRGVQKLFDKHGGCSQMLSAFYAASCALYGEDPNFREQPGDDLNFRMYDVADSMMLPTFMLLRSFDALFEQGTITPPDPGFYRTFNSAMARSKKSAREKFQEDKTVLLRTWSRFVTFHQEAPYQTFVDQFTRGFRLMLHTHKISIWFVFAAQVFLDIHHALRGYIDASIKKNLESHSSLSIAGWPKNNDMAFLSMLPDINRRVGSDPVEELQATDLARPGEMSEFTKWNPLICRVIDYSLQCAYPELGLTFQAAQKSTPRPVSTTPFATNGSFAASCTQDNTQIATRLF